MLTWFIFPNDFVFIYMTTNCDIKREPGSFLVKELKAKYTDAAMWICLHAASMWSDRYVYVNNAQCV